MKMIAPSTDHTSRLTAPVSIAVRVYESALGRLRTGTGDAYYLPAALPDWDDFCASLLQFKKLLAEASRASIKGKNSELEPELVQKVRTCFCDMTSSLHNLLDDPSKCSETVRGELGCLAQQELLPAILLTETAERFYSKPRGYAGDFYTIEMIYQDHASGRGKVGELVDRLFLDGAACQAVRNRRALLAEEIRKTIECCPDGRARVTSVACGPAEEVTDVYAALEDPAKLRTTLLDIDEEALEFVDKRVNQGGFRPHVDLVNENVLYLAIGRRQREFEPQDLVYSIGLIDYFQDKTVVRLLDWIHNILKPGGRVILGNFHPKNANRAFMDHILEWRLIHRTEEDMNRLFQASAFARNSPSIRFEDAGINLFAECVRGQD
jgi:extracellular factor (EF) 3-hydroxypalmitic acid methyl ester biosynthesis protein